jgi:hypothetical protein
MDINFLVHHFNLHSIESVWVIDSKKIGFYFKHAPYPWLIFDLDNQSPSIFYSVHMHSIMALLFSKHPLDALLHQHTLTSIRITDQGIVFSWINSEEKTKQFVFSSMPYHPTLTLSDHSTILFQSNPLQKSVSYPVVLHILETHLHEDLGKIHFNALLLLLKRYIARKRKRIEHLQQDKVKHQSLLFYKEVADDILVNQNMSSQYLLDTFNLTLPLHKFGNIGALVTFLFHQYKRAKQGLKTVESQLKKGTDELIELENFLTFIHPFSISHLQRLRTKLEALQLLNSKLKKPSLIQAENPYIFTYKNTTYSFGKNKRQNHHLTFHLAQKKYIFVHIKDFPGSHIIIHRQDFDHDSLVFAGQLSLYLSKQTSGMITYAKVGSLKATHTEGMVIVKNPKTMKINSDYQLNIEAIIKSATRY